MRAAARPSPSPPSWDPPYGTKPFPMTEILSSWNTWTWRNSCQRMASPRVRRSTTTALTPLACNQLPPRRPRSWISAAGPQRPSTRASRLRTVCRAPSGQASCCQQTAIHRVPLTLTPSRYQSGMNQTRQTLPSPASRGRKCLTLANGSSLRKN